MSKLILKEVGWKNFLSTGSAGTVIKLDVAPTTLISGATGSGKTSLNDAICFTWFNKALRNINKNQLINTINNGNTETFTAFSIGTNDYKITRGIKPNKLEILVNGVELDLPSGRDPQEWIEALIGFSYKTCKHVVLLGNASYTPFMQMKTPERRELVEDLRSLDVFSAMSKLAKLELDRLNKSFSTLNGEVMVLNNKTTMLVDFITESEKNTTDRKSLIENDIAEQMLLITSTKEKRSDLVTMGKALAETYQGKPEDVRREISELTQTKRDAMARKMTLEKNMSDLNKLTTCPTCKQQVGEDHKHGIEQSVIKGLAKIDSGIELINTDLDKLDISNNHNVIIERQLSELRSQIVDLDNKIKTAESFIAKYKVMIDDIQKSGNGIETRKSELFATKSMVELKEIELSDFASQISVLQESQRHLKDDGIKASLIDQFIPIFNSLVNKYLGMMDFFVRFELDKEFNESIKSRHRDEFSYYSFSEGEKQQIDLALLFAWRELTMLSGNALTNVIVLDEVFDSSLDANVTELVINILGEMDDSTNIVVISHKTNETFDTFERTITFEKIKNFSVIREL